MKKQDIRFQIDQLRKDKMIYAIESCATSIICVFSIFFLLTIGSEKLGYEVAQEIGIGLFIIALGYFIFMAVGNFLRLKKIKELEKNL